jgi:DNA-binding CsgD family transcriptional regulator
MTTISSSELSEREKEILRLVATGASNKEIAQQLFISANTVKVHLRNVFTKIGVASRTEAAMYAVKTGMVESAVAVIPVEPAPPSVEPIVALPLVIEPRSAQKREIPVWYVAVSAALILLAIFGTGFLFLARSTPPTPTVEVNIATPESRWKHMADMPTARSGLAAAAYENRIYAIGGDITQGVTGALEIFDPQTNTWLVGPSKALPVADVEAAVVGGKIYVPGGRLASGDVTNTLEIYNPQQDAWEQGTALPFGISAYALVAFEGKLYLFGGWDGTKYLASVYIYDPGQGVWSTSVSMPTARAYAGAAVAGGKIYVIGGYDGGKFLDLNAAYLPDRLDGDETPWEVYAPLPESLRDIGVASVADIVHVFGKNIAGDQSTTLEYLPASGTWQTFENSLTSQWSGFRLIASGSYLYLLGGQVDHRYSVQNTAYRAIYTIAVPLIP